MTSNASRPTSLRYLVIAAATLAAVLLYLERVCISVAIAYVGEDLRLSLREIDWALGIFFWAYALGQLPSGWLTDRFGPRRMMTIYLVAWSVFGVSIALAHSFILLLLARFALGLSQAGAYPTVTVLIKRWTPPAARGWASSVVAFGGRFGGAGANLLTAVIIVAFVPLHTPAVFTTDDILDLPKFQQQLHDKLPADEAAKVPAEIKQLRSLVRNRWEQADNDSLAENVAGLNALVQQPGIFDEVDLRLLPVPRDGREIAAISVGRRTSAQSERLNRLLLEVAFKESLRQLHGLGWRPALLVYGLGGVIVGLIFWWLVRDTPAQQPLCNRAEVELITAGQEATTTTPTLAAILPLGVLLTSRNMWMNSAAQFFSNLGWAFVVTKFPSYLAEVFSVPLEERGLMATMPLLISCGGMLVGGWLTDRLVRSLGLRLGRIIPVGVLKIGAVVALLSCPWLHTPWEITWAMAAMAAVNDLGTPGSWAFAQDVGGRHVGAVVGWANMWGNFGAGLSPLLVGWVVALTKEQSGWNAAFYLLAAAFVGAMITGALLDPCRPLLPESENSPP